jgi:hypothetical protein
MKRTPGKDGGFPQKDHFEIYTYYKNNKIEINTGYLIQIKTK